MDPLAHAARGASIFGLHLSEYNPLESVGQARDTAFLAAIITAGFGLLNACMSAMHVSRAMSSSLSTYVDAARREARGGREHAEHALGADLSHT